LQSLNSGQYSPPPNLGQSFTPEAIISLSFAITEPIWRDKSADRSEEAYAINIAYSLKVGVIKGSPNNKSIKR